MKPDGGGYPTLVEHSLITIRLYNEKWIKDKIQVDQGTLARLHFKEGLTNQQLATMLGISLSSIKLRLYGYDRTGKRKAK